MIFGLATSSKWTVWFKILVKFASILLVLGIRANFENSSTIFWRLSDEFADKRLKKTLLTFDKSEPAFSKELIVLKKLGASLLKIIDSKNYEETSTSLTVNDARLEFIKFCKDNSLKNLYNNWISFLNHENRNYWCLG